VNLARRYPWMAARGSTVTGMTERQPTVRMRELGLTIHRAAKAKGLTGSWIARRLDWPDTKVSRLFSGKREFDTVDFASIMAICEIHGPKRAELIEIARRAAEPGWWQDYGDRLPPELRTLSDYEDAAIAIVNFETCTVPGLLQTPNYMRALMKQTPAIPAKEIELRINARLNRQMILDRYHAARFTFFVDEYVLCRTGPGRRVMSEQVHHLLQLVVRPHIEIRVIPDAVGFHAGQASFMHMDFTELNPIVFLETQTSALFLERPETIATYRRVVTDLASVALDERRSRDWIAAVAADMGAPWKEHDERAAPVEEELPQQPD
jgi:hypothetical protein